MKTRIGAGPLYKFDYCDKLPVPEKHLLAFIEGAHGREMRQLENKQQLLSFVLG